jgi:kynureninase
MSAEDEYRQLDDKFPTYKSDFNIPTFKSLDIPTDSAEDANKEVVYFCGNSLGLMPKQTRKYINDELDAWSDRAVESHFRHSGANEKDGKTSWVDIDLPLVPLLAPIVGGLESEVAVMGSLTANLNALLTAFYQPQGRKTKILFEKNAFPSDYYSFYNQIKLKQPYNENIINVEDHLIQLEPKEGNTFLQIEDILKAIENNKDELSIVLLPGVQYYTGQFFDIELITKYAHDRDILCGWDLAHAAGNVPLKLHDWCVDFATWCSYKYLNSGPGGISGIFVHESHHDSTDDFLPRLAGWWGNNSSKRFQMLEKFEPISGALGFRQSNPSVIDVVSLKSSLDLIQSKGGIEKLREKSVQLTSYLWKLLTVSKYYARTSANVTGNQFTILTPEDINQRGAQLSLLFFPRTSSNDEGIMERINKYLNQHGVICDERRPDVIRFAPVPLYNSFKDVYKSVQVLNDAFKSLEL